MLPKRALKPDRPEGGSVDLFSPSLLQSLSLTLFLSRHLSLFLPPLCPCLHSILHFPLLPPHFPLPPLFFFSFTLTALHTLFHYDPLIPHFPFSSLCRWLNHEWCKRCVSFFLPDNVREPKTPQPSMKRERDEGWEKRTQMTEKNIKERERERKKTGKSNWEIQREQVARQQWL